MMKIRVISFQGQPLPHTISHDFDDLGGTIGRAETNQLALPDPQRHISRLQARVVCREGRFEIINQGANPINVDGHAIGNGSSMQIATGARIEIGGYLMEAVGPAPAAVHPSQDVTIAPEAFNPPPRPAVAPSPIAPQPAVARPSSMPQSAPRAPAAPPAPAPVIAPPPLASGPVDDPLGMFGGAPRAGADPFADILSGITAASPLPAPEPVAHPVDDPLAGWTPPLYTPPASESLADLLAQPAASRQAMPSIRPGMIPDDFDPFADPLAPLPERKEANPFDDMDFGLVGKTGANSSIDSMYELGPSIQPDTRDPFLGGSLGDPRPGRNVDTSLDPLAAFSEEPLPGPAYQSMPDQVPELHGSFVPPRVEPFAAPAPGAFAPTPPAPAIQPAEKGVFVSWDNDLPGQPGRGFSVLPAMTPASNIPAAEDPLLAMFDSSSPFSGAPAAGADVLGLGVAPAMPGEDLMAGLGAPPRAEAPAARAYPGREMPGDPLDFGAPLTLPGDTLFAGIGNVQPAESMIARAFAEPSAVSPAPARPQPTASATPPSPPKAVAASAPAPVQSTNEALTRAFLAGLGTPNLPLPDGVTPEMMERVGHLLREATQGTLDLLLARATTKREVRADVTMIVSTDNNPLKFSPDVAAALLHLLVPQGPGFLSPVAAMRDAYDDLRSHQFGFMAGLRAALAGVLKRFDPVMLEQRMAQKSMLDSVLPMNRRAKLWDLYIVLYRDIAIEAEEDFHNLFGREFLRAYQEQVERLGQGKP